MKHVSMFVLVLLLMAGCGPREIGSHCTKNKQCAVINPNAYCAKIEVCTMDCEERNCPEDSACSVQGMRNVCLPTCTDECRDTEACIDGVCVITNVLNPVLDAVRFWHRLEWTIERLLGVSKRPSHMVGQVAWQCV